MSFDRKPLKSGQVFGNWDAPITDDDEQIDTPTQLKCVWCEEQIQEGDNGRINPVWGEGWGGHCEHRECSFRQVMGGIGHLVNHAKYCHGELGTDAGLTHRQSALLVWDFFQDYGINLTTRPEALPEELRAHYEKRIEKLRK